MTDDNRGKTLPPRYFILFLIMAIAIHFIFPLLQIIDYPWNLTGLLLIVPGMVLNIIADRTFKQVHTTVKPFEKSSVLVQDRVYRLSRNPMYLGMVLILLGISILLGSVTPFMVSFAFAWLITIKFIQVEEKMLAERFAEDWQIYRDNVRRWI